MKRKILPYKHYLKPYARKLRKRMTLSEVLLWKQLKSKQIQGFQFNRQRPIDKYIVDFYCKDLLLAIEIDGESHNYPEAYENDMIRQRRLESMGVHFLRFSDQDIKTRLMEVVQNIHDWIDENGNLIQGKL